MALSIQQRIAHIENQLKDLKEELEEQEQEKQRVFIITFRLNTNQKNWGTIPLSSELVREQIGDYLTDMTDLLDFHDDGDRFDLLSVEEEFNTNPVSEPST